MLTLRSRTWCLTVALVLMVSARVNAHAEMHCIGNSQELLDSLAAARTPGAPLLQEFRLQSGKYSLQGASFVIDRRNERGSLIAIEGDYDVGCGDAKSQIGAQRTSIDGVNGVFLGVDGPIKLGDFSTDTDVTAMSMSGGVVVDRVAIAAVLEGQDALTALARDNVRLSNVLVRSAGNNCGIVAATFGGGVVRIEHATVAAFEHAGICLDGSDSASSVQLVNSIAETMNGPSDLLINTNAPAQIASNMFGSAPANLPPSASGNQLIGWEAFDPNAPTPASPSLVLPSFAVDAADPTLSALAVDVFGNPRLYSRPDIGAIETDRIFGAAFEQRG